MAMPEISPIGDGELDEYCVFLNRHLDPATPPERFAAGFRRRWGMDKPNHGFLIRADGELVGGIGAIYAERPLHGRPERFCNITSWCVLEAYRSQSMRLALAMVSQSGFHFTDLTPTEVVAKSLQFLKFKPLDGSRVVIPNLPWVAPGTRVETDPQHMASVLSGEAAQVYADHRDLPWLRHLVLGRNGAWCHVIYKPKTLKGLPSAEVIGFSDGELFLRHLRALGAHLLLRHGMATTRVEARLLPRIPTLGKLVTGYRPKMYRSDTLQAAEIDNLYSELVALDL